MDLLAKFGGITEILHRCVDASLLGYFPIYAKYIVAVLLVFNARSLPLAWHLRIFKPIVAVWLKYKWFKLRMAFSSREQRRKLENKWFSDNSPVGKDPLNTVIPYYSWASLDDTDYNFHLSNSSYAKACDAARLKAVLEMFPVFLLAGGGIAVAATHYDFIREIPMLAPYEVRVSLKAWDQKWLFITYKFVTKSKKTRQVAMSESNGKPATGGGGAGTPPSNLLLAPVTTSDSTSSVGTSPTPSNVNDAVSPANTKKDLDAASRTLGSSSEAKSKHRGAKMILESDGAILHAVGISQVCFKVGRVTVPPALALAVNGFSTPPLGQGIPYSQGNPPPSWLKAKELISNSQGGSVRRLREFLKGGWREVPEDKWWEEALSGSTEERRQDALKGMTELRSGIESARG